MWSVPFPSITLTQVHPECPNSKALCISEVLRVVCCSTCLAAVVSTYVGRRPSVSSLKSADCYAEMVSLNAQIRERMRGQVDDGRTAALEARLEKARNQYESFQTALYAAHPDLKAKRGLFPLILDGKRACRY